MRIPGLFNFVALLLPLTSFGQEVLPDPEAILEDRGEAGVAAETTTTGGLEDLAPEKLREGLTSRVARLRKIPTAEGLHLPLPLQISNRERGALVGFEEYEYRYRLEKRKIPRYEYEYEEYEEYVQVPASNDPYETRMVHKKVTRQRVTSRQVVGYDIQEVKVPDPSGPHTTTTKVPKYEIASSAYVHHGFFGSNAMVFLSMLKCGLPATDERLAAGLDSLTSALIAYGAPDRTWDLAWVTALYVNLPQDNALYRDWTTKLVGKLVAGAHQDGPGAGLWGPNCINPDYLAEIIKYDQKFKERYLNDLDKQIQTETRERTKARLEEKKREILDIHERWAFIYKIWGICGLNPYASWQAHVFPAEVDRQPTPMHIASGRLPGLVCDYPSYQTADLESTAMALFALKEAAEQKLLPDATPTPYDIKLRPLADPVSTRAVLGNSLDRLLEARNAGGRWNSTTRFHEHKAFRAIELNEPIVRVADCKNLPSREHPVYQALACASLRYLATCLEGISGERAATAADQVLPTLWPELAKLADHLEIDDLPGRHAILWHLSELCTNGSREGRKTWERLALSLLKAEGRAEPVSTVPPGAAQGASPHSLPKFLEASGEALVVRQEALRQKAGGADPAALGRLASFRSMATINSLCYRPDLALQSTTMAFLVSGIRPPAFAFWQQDGQDRAIPTPLRVVCQVYRKKQVNVTAIKVGRELPLDEVVNTPFVMLQQDGNAFDPGDEARQSLAAYLSDRQGTLLVLCRDDDEGVAFWEDVVDVVQSGGVVAKSSKSEGKGVKIHTMSHEQHPLVVCIMAPSGNVPDRQVARTINTMLKKKLPSIYFESDYPLMLDRLRD